MMPTARWQHARRITGYVLVMFSAFVMSWVALLAKVRSGAEDTRPTLVTDVEIHSMQARWGVDLLTVPLIAVVIAAMRRSRRAVGDVVIALFIGLTIAIGMAYFPSAVMGGHIWWPVNSTRFDTNGYIGLSLTYAIVIVAVLLIVNRIAARRLTRTNAAS